MLIAQQELDPQAVHLKDLADVAFGILVQSHSDMDLIDNPRSYTRHQNNLMEVLVGYVWN